MREVFSKFILEKAWWRRTKYSTVGDEYMTSVILGPISKFCAQDSDDASPDTYGRTLFVLSTRFFAKTYGRTLFVFYTQDSDDASPDTYGRTLFVLSTRFSTKILHQDSDDVFHPPRFSGNNLRENTAFVFIQTSPTKFHHLR